MRAQTALRWGIGGFGNFSENCTKSVYLSPERHVKKKKVNLYCKTKLYTFNHGNDSTIDVLVYYWATSNE